MNDRMPNPPDKHANLHGMDFLGQSLHPALILFLWWLVTGQNIDHVDSLFTGNILGHKSDIADGTLRGYEFRTFNNIADGYYIAPRFLDAVAVCLFVSPCL
jgi:hypothetical protein